MSGFKFDKILLLKSLSFGIGISLNNKKESDQREFKSLMTGQKVWNRAKKSIAGGNMLFSKRPDVFLPDKWPSYFKKAKGCIVEDLDLSLFWIGS